VVSLISGLFFYYYFTRIVGLENVIYNIINLMLFAGFISGIIVAAIQDLIYEIKCRIRHKSDLSTVRNNKIS